jgi:TRAP-type transport system periplasmic protein
MNRNGKVLITIILIIFALAGTTYLRSAPATAAKPIEIRFGHVGFPGSLFDATSTEFAKRVNAALKGKVEVKVFHSSQLGKDAGMLKGVKVGTLEMFLPSTIMSTVEGNFGVFEMPYIIVDRAHMKRVAENARVRELLLDPLPAKGVRALAFWENGFRQVTNNVRPINKPEDLKGIKLRTPKGVWRVKMFQAYGANPTPLAFAEVFSALQTGVMDGQENPLAQIWAGKFQEVQKYLSFTGHVYTPAYPTVGEQFWQGLPADVRETIAKIAVEMGDFARAEGARFDKELGDKICSQVKCNDADKEAFIKASAPVYNEFSKENKQGGELIKRVQSLR